MLDLMRKLCKPLKYIVWITTFLWMGMLFYFSSQPAEVSLNVSGKVLVTMDRLEEKEIQNISDRHVWNLQNTIRKHAHFITYFVLGFLMALSFVLIRQNNYWVYLYSWLAASLYGVLDEVHQSFVPGRGAMLSDMALDSVSALLGTIVAIVFIFLCKLYIKNIKQ